MPKDDAGMQLDAAPARAGVAERTLSRVAKYAVVRAVTLSLMVAVGIFLVILVVNYGGYIDQIAHARIYDALQGVALSMPGASQEEINQAYIQAQKAMEEAAGLNQPFLARCVRWWIQALTFDWGKSSWLGTTFRITANRNDVTQVILDHTPNTLAVAGTANILVFATSLGLALALSRRHSSALDKLLVALSPVSSIPNWAYGILLTVIFAAELHWLPANGMYDVFPPATKLGYVPIIAKHMILPVLAIFLSLFFQTVYGFRTFFLIHSGEDYLEMAEAQGLPARMIERRYILRPVLPYIITSFALTLIGFWQGVLVLEYFFKWPGVGYLFLEALKANDRGVTVGLIVIFAVLLAVSVFLLDVLYAVVDPRVRLGKESQTVRPVSRRSERLRLWVAQWGQPRPTPWAARPVVEHSLPDPKPMTPSASISSPWRRMRGLGAALRELARYPSVVAGVGIIVVMIGVSIYAVVAVPYSTAVERWRMKTEEPYKVPAYALPTWINLFRKNDLPSTIVQDSRTGGATKTIQPGTPDSTQVALSFSIQYPYQELPQDVLIHFVTRYEVKQPFVSLTWLTPDGRQLDLGRFSVSRDEVWWASQDLPSQLLASQGVRVQSSYGGKGGYPAAQILLAQPGTKPPVTLAGTYTLHIDGFVFEENSTLDAEVVLPGRVYGLAGTDDMRRDLTVALLWGTPVALAFGFLGAVATSLLTMTIAAVGTWFGGRVDGLIQRLTEVNMMLPALPMALMVYYIYSKSVWAILGVMVLINIFGGSIKSFRAAFLQVKQLPYVEAAQTYGAGHWRIITRYLVPRMLPILVPQLVIMIPTYVFFEATLSFLGVSDPNLPTWGKVIYDALTGGAFEGNYYWILEPLVLIMLTGLAFAMVGFALDRILNPRLRSG